MKRTKFLLFIMFTLGLVLTTMVYSSAQWRGGAWDSWRQFLKVANTWPGVQTFNELIIVADDAGIGLGAAKGRIVFKDETTDEISIQDVNVDIGGNFALSQEDASTSAVISVTTPTASRWPTFRIENYISSYDGYPIIQIANYGGTSSGVTKTPASKTVGQYRFRVHDGTDPQTGAYIYAKTTASYDTGDEEVDMIFGTRDGTTTGNHGILTHDGKWGFGKESADYVVDIESSAQVAAKVKSTSDSGTKFVIDSNDNEDAIVTFLENGTTRWMIGHRGTGDVNDLLFTNLSTLTVPIMTLDYDRNHVRINTGPDISGVSGFLVIGNASGHLPSGPADAVAIYSLGGEGFIGSSSGATTQLTTHPEWLADIADPVEDPMPYGHESRNIYTGWTIKVYSSGVAKTIQDLWNELHPEAPRELIWYENNGIKVDPVKTQKDEWKRTWIVENTKMVEVDMSEATTKETKVVHLEKMVEVTEDEALEVVEIMEEVIADRGDKRYRIVNGTVKQVPVLTKVKVGTGKFKTRIKAGYELNDLTGKLYGLKMVAEEETKHIVKPGYEFNEKTEKFYRKDPPSMALAEIAADTGFVYKPLPKLVEDRR